MSPASRLFTELFIQAQIKENIKAPRHWPLCGKNSPVTGASNAENISIIWRHHIYVYITIVHINLSFDILRDNLLDS